MISIDPPRSRAEARLSPIHKRELTQFLRSARSAAGLVGAVSVLLTDDSGIQRLNREFRRKDHPTDVLSFPSLPDPNGARPQLAGDLAISLDTAARQAAEHRHSLAIELRILTLHGLLHLAGYDHERDSGEMARVERKLRRHFGLPAGLIQRSNPAPSHARTSVRKGRTR